MNEEEKNVIDDMLHGAKDDGEQDRFKALGETIREYVRKGNVTRIIIKRGADVLVNLPLSAGIIGGIIGAVAAPWALIMAAIATAGFDCRVELVKDDGEIVDLGFNRFGDAIRSAGASVAGEFRGVFDGMKGAEAPEDAEPAADEEIPFEDVDK